jgi:hypothetical protein
MVGILSLATPIFAIGVCDLPPAPRGEPNFGGITMRRIWISAAAMAALVLGGASLLAADCGCQQQEACGCNGDGFGDPCGGCGRHCCGGLFGHHRNRAARYEGMEEGFNCGCNGSYKFPVPPLYTYHWPGMWQQNLMTDYHSPWRFPPLKPYADETLPGSMGTTPTTLRRVQQASASIEVATPSERISFSGRMEQMLR